MAPRTFNIVDVLRRLRLVRGPTEVYQQFNDYTVTVGAARIPLSPIGSQGRFTCKLAVIQADLANAGIITVGGPNVGLGVGTQLTAGLAVLWAASSEAMFQQRALMGGLGAGLVPWMERAEEIEAAANQVTMPKVLIDLNTHYCSANAAGQILRIQYTQDVEVP
ncbi:MAG: hypothetical protein GY950_00740 [bacterium]|nr:hypothetical protein [bacterium]